MQRGFIPGQQDGRKKQREYGYAPDRRKRRLLLLCAVLLAGVMVFSAWQLISYGADYVASRNASGQLREMYYQETEVPSATATPEPTGTSVPTAAQGLTPTPATGLEAVKYPGNPYGLISSRFQKIRRQNSDIIGWLSIADLLDEAVVQKDNTYYLRRDYRGFHNVNGALFLDESITLNTRPYTLYVYGHNMKTGAMFGSLRNYENLKFYQNNAFITFNTMYEDGRYVIFSVTELSINARDRNYFSFGRLNSDNIAWRREGISDLKSHSIYFTEIDVQPEDQILLLITCVDDEEERRVVAARRVREGEKEETLQRKINTARKW